MTTTPTTWKGLHEANQTDAGNQNDAAIVDIGMGRYVVVWTELSGGPIGTDPGQDLVGQIFDAEGNPVGNEFQVNQTYFNDNEHNAALAARPGGGFVVAYEDTDGGGTSIRVQAYDVNGNLVFGGPSTIAEDLGDDYANPSIAMNADGSYLVTYERTNGAGDTDILARIVDDTGAVSVEHTIYDEADDTLRPDVATLSNGSYVVVFDDENVGDSGNHDAKFQIVSSAGVAGTGGTIASGAADQSDVHVAALAGGGFVAVWTEAGGDGNGDGIVARLYGNDGVPDTDAFVVNSSTTGVQYAPDVTALADGGFVVVWDDNNAGVEHGQRFDSDGDMVGTEFVAGNLGAEMEPVVASLSDGRFIVGFEQVGGPDTDIHVTIFDPRENVINGDGEDNVITSRLEGATVNGFGGADTLLGQKGDDTLDGGIGVDVMRGRAGNDVYFVDEVLDQAIEAAGEGTDLVISSVSYALGANVENLTLTGGAVQGIGNGLANVFTGNALANTFFTFDGNDWLDGGAGADNMNGGTGNDIYFVDNAGDKAIENAGAGTDTVVSSVSFTLGANVENLTLTGSATHGTGNDLANLIIGNGSANTLSGLGGNDRFRAGAGNDTVYGGAGDDYIDGSTGADVMRGGADDDTYVVDNAGDQVIETIGEGIDLVTSSVTFVLGANVENLTLATGAGDIDGTGNVLANTITGNDGANKLLGLGGGDTLVAGAGDDRARGGKGSDILLGGDGRDKLYGNGGKDKIAGGLGKDKLLGNKGKDCFIFDTELGGGNRDRIKGFAENKDKIWLEKDVFSAIGDKLGRGEFFTGKKAHDGNDHLIHDDATGRIYYDADGKGGAGKVLFARVDKGVSLDHKDFAMIDDFVV